MNVFINCCYDHIYKCAYLQSFSVSFKRALTLEKEAVNMKMEQLFLLKVYLFTKKMFCIASKYTTCPFHLASQA